MKMSHHAQKRKDRRWITDKAIAIALKHGIRIHRAGALFIFLRKKDLPKSISSSYASKLEGITILIDSKSKEIITVYKNKEGLRDIKRKLKYFIN